MTVKEQARVLVEELPDDATWGDVIYWLCVCQKMSLRTQIGEEGRGMSHEELKRRVRGHEAPFASS